MSPSEPIAVIGSGCRFPGESTNPSKLWQLLQKPRDVLGKIDRFKSESFYHTDGHHHGTSNVLDSYLLTEDPRKFDAQFFNIQAGEAETIDPQQRLLLETIYEGMEAAGVTIEELQGSPTAVYVGVMCDDYGQITYHDSEAVPTYAATGSARSIMSNRISYFFDWRGPSMTIDTACSSSLVAVHQAVQVLRSGESRVAVAAGANLIFGPNMFIAESNLNMLSPTGRSRMWDEGADGYARGEGVAAVVLKTLSAAIADGDDIECIVRETGVNQDGHTMGITMPSSSAQAELIRQTYTRAGLDLKNPLDRCQYFEAHGTGTKAGDPQEARAIAEAFFGHLPKPAEKSDDILYVGSIKTVIGHTEGTAGLAGLLKASLAVQNKIIPPNMHFNTLNPDIEDVYGHLEVATAAKEWPELPAGVARRVSVNSFGFGGTNAHAIIENYAPKDDAPVKSINSAGDGSIVATPFTFSATSEKALATQLTAWLAFLQANPDVNLRDLSWTLSRRSAFSFRASCSATDVDRLCEKIEQLLEDKKAGPIAIRPITKNRRVLGVFTGQGAQWATMGKELILASKFFEGVIDYLEKSLSELPEGDRPTWSLKEEIMAGADTSRLSEGALSQPLCTAVQVAVVDILKKAGLGFDAVVGHSSGEIAAAYAAGFISSWDAIRIAHYRGVYTKLARGPSGQRGAMMAAGTSMEDALELCDLPTFAGRLQLAASNSSASVTLSGDKDAVEEARIILEDESKFARALKVDTAYHSHHMQPCSGPYVKSLHDCKINISKPNGTTQWYSSVLGGTRMESAMAEDLQGVYWKDNMLKPVLFSQALAAAVGDGAPAIALEVGPHAALKGPASLTIEETLGNGIPYSGTLVRGVNDVEALATALGFTWSHFGPTAVDFAQYDELFSKGEKPTLCKEFPSYTWDKERTYWLESRASKAHRLRPDPTHELLGVRIADDAESEYRWRNFIKPTEIPWLRGHQIQGQTLFPAAGFAAMALEASKSLASTEEIRMIELLNFSIHRALSFNDEAAGVETIFSLSNVTKDNKSAKKAVIADFVCYACPNKDSGKFTSMANGQVKVYLGEPSLLTLPDRPAPPVNMTDVDIEVFYDSLANIGYNYSEMFKGIFSLQRKMDVATGSILIPEHPDSKTQFVFHPATLDVAFQSIFAAIGAPGDGRLWTLHVPTMIKKIQVNPFAVPIGGGVGIQLPFNADLSVSIADGISGDVTIYDEAGQNAVVQVEALHVSPLSTPSKNDDRQIYAETVWDIAAPNGELVFKDIVITDGEKADAALVERVCLFYLKQLNETITPEEREACEWQQSRVLEWAAHTVSLTADGKHPTCKKEWLNDTYTEIDEQITKMAKQTGENFEDFIFVGERLIPFVRGEVSFIDEFVENNVLEHFYPESHGYVEYNDYLGGIVKQITHRYQHMSILEIGAGTGDSTSAILRHIGQAYSSYTYTDISAGSFEDAAELFKEHANKFTYKELDIQGDIIEQGFAENSYDLVIASRALSTTASLEETLKNARQLLKPGGYLLMLENTNSGSLRTGFMFCGMPEWWSTEDEDRKLSPLVSQKTWDSILRQTGFSGIDTATPESKTSTVPFSIMASMAVDTQINFVRQPLSLNRSKPLIEDLLILGGSTLPTFRLVDDCETLLTPFCKRITIVDSLENLEMDVFTTKPVVLSLTELDVPVFNPFTAEKLKAVSTLLEKSKTVLWLVQGSTGEEPYSNMMIAVGRCMIFEMPDLLMQFLDVDFSEKPDSKVLSEFLLRLQIGESWKSNADYKPLWTVERELRISKGCITIPRYLPHAGPNDRFNSAKRVITKKDALDNSIVRITHSDTSYDLQEYRTPQVSPIEDDHVTIQVHRSILSAVKLKSVGFLNIILGVDVKSRQKVVAFSEDHRSVVSVPRSWTIPTEISEDKENYLLLSIAIECMADAIIGNAGKRSSLLVHEPLPVLASALKRRAADREMHIAYTTTKTNRPGFNRIHSSAPGRVLEDSIPRHVTIYADLSGNTDPESTGNHILASLPRSCKVRNRITLTSPESFLQMDSSEDKVTSVLRDSYDTSMAALSGDVNVGPIESLALMDIPKRSTKMERLQVVDWTTASEVPVRVFPAEHDVEFQKNKTYLLIGLTGELGLSLCRWMVNRGAKYIAITSRNPNIDPAWLAMMKSKGAVVKAFAMDLTNKESLMSVHEVICRTMPPIAGVANGAMVNNEGLFTTISHEDFDQSLKPKVDGSIYLNELFCGNDLDFFILFSSLAAVTGNIGQTPYSSANAFMGALVAGRRKKGLVGSVMNLAGILGLGYITRRDASILERLLHMGYANISEWDFHQFFAEAVVAGHPESGRNPELSSGLTEVDPEKTKSSPAWLYLPKFSHYRVVRGGGKNADGDDKESVSIRAQLAEQTTEEGVYKVLLDGLQGTLSRQLHLSPEDISPDTTIVELGVDSLVAVDMRSWFTNELEIDMPVLKLLGGATVADLVEDAVERISRDLVPNLATAEEAKPETADAEAPAKEGEETTATEIDDAASSHASTPVSEETEDDVAEDETAASSVGSVDIKYAEAQEDTESVVAPEEVKQEEAVAAIVRPKFQKTARMSYGASRFWFLNQYLEDTTTFNCIARTKLTGNLKEADLARAVEAVGQRHEAFRTAFFANADRMNEPTQGVLAKGLLRLETKNIADEKEAIKESETMLKYTFDLERGESIRLLLLTVSPTLHFLIFGFHHIMIDGFSFNILVSDLNKLYANQSLPPVSSQFTDFAKKQRRQVESGAMGEELRYWRGQFPTFPEPVPLFPLAQVKSRLPIKNYDFEEVEIILDKKTITQVRDTCRRNKSTSFHFFLAVLKIWTFNFLDIDDLVIGMADANRTDIETTGTVGFLLNLLPLRFKANPKQTFGDAITEARTKAYSALANSKLPFDVLLEELDIPRSSSHSPLFQIFMDYRQIAVKTPTMLGARADGVSSMGRTAYDLVLDVNEVAGSDVKVGFRTQKYLYSRSSTEILFKSYIELVKLFASNTHITASKAPLFNAADIKAAMDLGRGPTMKSDWPATIAHRIDNIVAEHPESIATKDGVGNQLTYGAMADRVNIISSHLSEIGVSDGSKVAVFQEPSSEWICSLLAIWKAGAVYVPLELKNGLPRLAVIVKDCAPTAIICHEQTMKDLPALAPGSSKIVNLSDMKSSVKAAVTNKAQSESPAVILYTSGSTGTPKGIVLRHSSIRNEMEGYSKEWKIGQETVLQQSAYSFDFSLDQMLAGLSNGGTVYVVPKSKRGDPTEIAKLMATENITYTKATPSEYSSWIRYGSASLASASQWKFAFGGGEVWSHALTQEFRTLEKPGLTLHNSYGPGEITISCTKAVIPYIQDSDESVPAGFPLPNYALYIVDRNLDPVPVGVTGEILIGGAGAALGYLANDKLTNAKFIPNRYTPPEYAAEGWSTVYRSGDLGRLRSDGALMFEGRIDGDNQVKLRGLRIELEDIESTIIQAAGGVIAKAVASVRGDPQFLIAHVELSTEYPAAERDAFLKDLLTRLPLPQYMCPAMLIPLDALPLNNHSKVNRLAIKALPLPQASKSSESDGDLTETEKAVKRVWEQVITKDVTNMFDIGRNTDFFHVGGNSMLLVKLQAALRSKLQVVLPMIELFEASTLSTMAAKVESANAVVKIDWRAETAVSQEAISTPAADSAKKPVGAGQTVLLTGPTGFLGRNILKKLVADKRVSKIHCVAVRQNGAEPRKLAAESKKITVHAGNLAEPSLGLCDDDFNALASEVDVIIHSGANRSFWDYYQQLKGPNVGSTKELARMASARKIPVHFVSSGGVLSLSGDDDAAPGSMAQFKPPVDGSIGYVASKWSSEAFLENASRKLGLPVHIHRLTPAAAGDNTAPPALMQEFADLATQLKVLPSSGEWTGTFDLIPVAALARDICNAALNDKRAERQVGFVHHRSSLRLQMADVAAHLETLEGRDQFERMPPHKWVGRAKDLGISYHFASQDFTITGKEGSGELQLKR